MHINKPKQNIFRNHYINKRHLHEKEIRYSTIPDILSFIDMHIEIVK
jgi:hypothetical protein